VTLIQVVSSRLFKSISDHTFPSAPNSSVAAYASSFIKSATVSQEQNATKEVLNCIRVLQRVLPVVFEVESESNTFELDVIWKREEVKDEAEGPDSPQFVIEDEEESDRDTNAPSTPATKEKTKLLPSLGERLFSALTDLMFCCGFTLPKSIQLDHHKINYVIWYVWFSKVSPLSGPKFIDLC
jgi:hypothetical protein